MVNLMCFILLIFITTMSSYYNLLASKKRASSLPSFDPDAQAFITAAAITDNTQQNAINTLVLALKGYSIWTKFKAIYPIVGGTASQHKFNLKDPRDLDAAFRLTFATGLTHSATGILPNGVNGYANTYFNVFSQLAQNDLCGTYYSRTNSSINGRDFGVNDVSFNQAFYLLIKNAVGNYAIRVNTSTTTANTMADSRGFFAINRLNATNQQLYRNGSGIVDAAVASVPCISDNLFLFASNRVGVGAASFTNRECAFASFGEGLVMLRKQLIFTQLYKHFKQH
jgi:hypothetical protein